MAKEVIDNCIDACNRQYSFISLLLLHLNIYCDKGPHHMTKCPHSHSSLCIILKLNIIETLLFAKQETWHVLVRIQLFII